MAPVAPLALFLLYLSLAREALGTSLPARWHLRDNTQSSNVLTTGYTTNSCASSGYSSCGKGLPDNFCCPSESTCLILASNTTAICCPAGQDCSTIRTITCDIQQQNITVSPESEVLTTSLSKALPSCGINCCPFGYRCNADLDCELEKESASAATMPSTTVTSSSAQKSITITDSTSYSPSPTVPTPYASATQQSAYSTSTAVLDAASNPNTENGPNGSENRTRIAVGCTVGAAGFISVLGALIYFWTRPKRSKTRNAQASIEGQSTWKQGRPRHDRQGSELTKFHTWRGQSYYAPAATKHNRVLLKHSEPVYYAELPATPVPFSVWNRDQTLFREPPMRPKSTYRTYIGTKPGKSQDRWSLR